MPTSLLPIIGAGDQRPGFEASAPTRKTGLVVGQSPNQTFTPGPRRLLLAHNDDWLANWTNRTIIF